MNQTYFVLTPDGICKKFLSGALTKEKAIQDYIDKTDGEIPKGTLMVEEEDIDSWTWNPVKKIWESKDPLQETDNKEDSTMSLPQLYYIWDSSAGVGVAADIFGVLSLIEKKSMCELKITKL